MASARGTGVLGDSQWTGSDTSGKQETAGPSALQRLMGIWVAK